jgi:hypothetical protein
MSAKGEKERDTGHGPEQQRSHTEWADHSRGVRTRPGSLRMIWSGWRGRGADMPKRKAPEAKVEALASPEVRYLERVFTEAIETAALGKARVATLALV